MENFTLFAKALTLAQTFWKKHPYFSTFLLISFAFFAGQNEDKVKELYATGKGYLPTWTSSVEQPFKRGTSLYVIVEDNSASLRKEANKKNADDKLIEFNSKVLFIEKTNDENKESVVNHKEVLAGWFQVTYQDELWYIYAGSVSETKSEEINYASHSEEDSPAIVANYSVDTHYSLGDGVKIREDFGIDAKRIKGEFTLDKGEKIEVLNDSGDFSETLLTFNNKKHKLWYYVQSLENSQKEGWVYGGCIRHIDEVDVLDEDMFGEAVTYNDVRQPY